MKAKLKDMAPDTMRGILWMLLHRNGGSVTFTEAEMENIPWRGNLFLKDGKTSMTLHAVVCPQAESVKCLWPDCQSIGCPVKLPDSALLTNNSQLSTAPL